MGAPTGAPIARFGRADVPDSPDGTDLRPAGCRRDPPAGGRARRTVAGERQATVPDRVRPDLDRPRRRPRHRDRARPAGPRRRSSSSGRRSSSAASRSRSSCRSMSIIFATMFAVIGALGRLSRVAPIYATATLYVSIIRGTPLIVQIFFSYLALPQFGIVLAGARRRHLGARLQLRRIHDRDLPGGHPGDPARPARGRRGARMTERRRCAGSSCRRRCASSSRPSAMSSSR